MIRKTVVALILPILMLSPMPALAAGRGYLGVVFATLPPTETRIQRGVLVDKVYPGSAAQRAGLKTGEIVTQIDGVEVANPQSAVDVVTDHGAGDKVTLTVFDMAGGKLRQVNIVATLAANPPGDFAATANSKPVPLPPAPANGPPAAAARGRAAPGGPGNGPAVPVALLPLRSGACSAMAPQGWQVADTNRELTVFTITSPGGEMRASYAITGVGSGLVGGFYGPQYRTPATFAQYATGVVFGGQVYAKPPQPMPYGFQMIVWGTQNGFSGYTIFKTYGLPSDPGGYIVSLYIGGAPSSQVKQLVPLSVGVATTIRCTAQLRPPPPNDFHPARGASCVGSACSESDAAASDFNSTLGTGYVHDDAGNNYYVGDENWIENGKDGPGYYKRNGNDVTKLQPGLQ